MTKAATIEIFRLAQYSKTNKSQYDNTNDLESQIDKPIYQPYDLIRSSTILHNKTIEPLKKRNTPPKLPSINSAR